MIEFTCGDLLKDESDVLVNTVNCVGVMGRGIALQFKKSFPENFKAYAAACKRGEVRPGLLFIYDTGDLTPPRYIVNFPTKRHWKGKSRIDDIETGLVELREFLLRVKPQSIAIPPLGAGLGGLEWPVVRKSIESALSDLGHVRIRVYEPKGAPAAATMAKSSSRPQMTAGRATLVGLVDRYLAGLLDPFATLLEVHKLMYFLEEAGEPLRLDFRKAPYGPYSEKLRHVLTGVEGHFLEGYADGGDAPEKELQLLPGAIDDAWAFLRSHNETRTRFDRIGKLVEGYESPFGMELLSTVHWVCTHNPVKELDDVVCKVYAWGDRKRQFTRRQIGLAFESLVEQGWVDIGQS